MLEWINSNHLVLSTQDSDFQERESYWSIRVNCSSFWPTLERASWSTVLSSTHAVGIHNFPRNPQRKIEDWKGTTAPKLNPSPNHRPSSSEKANPSPPSCYSGPSYLATFSTIFHLPVLQFYFFLWFFLSLHSSHMAQFSWLPFTTVWFFFC